MSMAIVGVLCLMAFSTRAIGFTNDQAIAAMAKRAEAAWMDGAIHQALDMLDQGIRDYPQALPLQKLRADILATTRRHQEAVVAYEAILQTAPEALDVRWAKWSVLLRAGQGDHAIAEFERIVQHDPNNPVAKLRFAQELRKRDRLEESLKWYQNAVELVTDIPEWRLAMARVQFDVLDGRGARDEVNRVLSMVAPGSPEEAAARSLLSVIYGATKERGRRFQYIFTPDGTAAARKEWAIIRAEAWRLYEAGRYQEAEPIYRKILVLNPSDFAATHELGMTLIALDRCKEAITIFDAVHTMDPSDAVYADTIFRIARCKMKLEQWADALLYFQILYDAAVEFEERTKDVPPKAGQRVLSKEELAKWLKKVKQQNPTKKDPRKTESRPVEATSQADMTEEDLYRTLAREPFSPDKQVFTRASLMGRDADFSVYRYIIPASRVMRDNLPGGAHDFIPINPGDTFSRTQEEIYLVFGLTTASYDEVPFSVTCYLETAAMTEDQQAIAQDHIVLGMNDQTGYFLLTPPETGWPLGLHRCGLFVGNKVSAYTHVDEVRFRIVEPIPSSTGLTLRRE